VVRRRGRTAIDARQVLDPQKASTFTHQVPEKPVAITGAWRDLFGAGAPPPASRGTGRKSIEISARPGAARVS